MANAEPTIEFYKGAAGVAAASLTQGQVAARALDAAIDISYRTLAPGNPQSGNWMHKIADPNAGSVPGETDLWQAPLPAALAPPVDSGVGFINGNGLVRDIIQGEISSFVNILIFNNRAHAVDVSAAENCFLRTYDSPTATTQTKEPMIGLGGGEHTFWLQVEQRNYWLYSGGVWAAEAPGMPAAHRGPYHLGATSENQWSAVLPTPNAAVVPFNNVAAKEGLGYFACGSGNAGVGDKHYLGCGNGQDPLTDNDGACVDLSMCLFVPEVATAKALYWALALEYTFVVE